uniref:Immunoglobulin-binding protein 1 n=1 Tax=Prolemur simus TaxID=1328070 RepID=A0A8C9DML5_PROSS
MAAAEDEAPLPRLPELFDSGQRLLDEVEVATEPTGSRTVQDKVSRALSLLEEAADMLSQLDLLGPGEDLEEVASADLKYLLVPALRGALTLKQAGPGQRLGHLRLARKHFTDYLSQCRRCRLAPSQSPPAEEAAPADGDTDAARPPAAPPGPVAMAARRRARVERYRERTEAERGLSALRSAVESGQAGDEGVRDYYVLSLRRWVGVSLEEIESIDREMALLGEKDATRAAAAAPASPPPGRPRPRASPLTRSAAQAGVFGAGYPSLASVTVRDWYDRRGRWAALPGPGAAGFNTAARPREDPEPKEEEEEEQTLPRAREWDDWKDTHPRGFGNRQNMG